MQVHRQGLMQRGLIVEGLGGFCDFWELFEGIGFFVGKGWEHSGHFWWYQMNKIGQ